MSYSILYGYNYPNIHQKSSLIMLIVEDTATLGRAQCRSIYEWFTVFTVIHHVEHDVLNPNVGCFPLISTVVLRGGTKVFSSTVLLLSKSRIQKTGAPIALMVAFTNAGRRDAFDHGAILNDAGDHQACVN
jgi:hypothetical protein